MRTARKDLNLATRSECFPEALEADWVPQQCAHARRHITPARIFTLRKARPLPRAKRAPNPDFAPISAAAYFADALQVAVAPRALDCRVYYTAPKFAGGTVIVCHHGAGYSGLSFACLARELGDMSKGECGVLALDARRHGSLFARVHARYASYSSICFY
jgi:hypothetical protein